MTAQIPHLLMVLYTGIVFLASGVCLLEVCRLLGKAYEKKASAPWPWRLAHLVGAVILFGYGCVILFPGQALKVQHMSPGLPLVGTVGIVAALAYLDHVMGEREPPRWTVQMIRVLALLGMEGLSRLAAFLLPAAPLDAVPADDEAPEARTTRIAVLVGSIAVIAAVAGFILTNSAGAAA